MSGNKSFDLVGAAVGVVAAPIILAGATAGAAINAAKAYEERQQREREAAVQKEQAVQQRIAKIRAGINKKISPIKVVHQPSVVANSSTRSADLKSDVQKQVKELADRLPGIVEEYQSLVNQGVLDAATVEQALSSTQSAVSVQELAMAQSCLRALDDARQHGMKAFEESRQDVRYVEERLAAMRDRLPQVVVKSIEEDIAGLYRHGVPSDDPDLLGRHQRLSEYEAQVDRVQEAADHLLDSWQEVGFVVHGQQIDDGDLVMAVETHEGANTELRVQFDGQQILLNGPAEETSSCAARTHEVLQLFQEQGYYLEWDSMDGQPVTEEWRRFYSVSSEALPVDAGGDQEYREERRSIDQGVL
jgi:hypothetical protein